MHRSQIFFYILLSFIVGVFAGSFFNISKNIVLFAAIICALLIVIFYRRNSRLLNVKLALAAFLVLFFLAGILRFNNIDSRTHNLQKFAEAQENIIDPQSRHPIKITIYGYITNEPEISGDKQRFIFFAKKLNAGSYVIDLNDKILVTARLYPQYYYGDKLKIYGQIKKPEKYSDFDYIAYLAKDSVFTTMFYPEITGLSSNLEAQPLSKLLSKYEKAKTSIFKRIFTVKNAFQKSINRSVSEPNAAFIEGILLGSRSQIPQEIKDDFVRTGTSHILAISGYNIAMIALITSWFFLLFFRRPIAFWFSLATVVLFTILTGAQASVVRAAIMGAIVLLARREGRLNNPRNAIVFAGAAMILLNPLILRHNIGFQLSFAATLGLIYLAPVIEKYFARLPKFFGLRETMVMTVSAQIFVLPLLIYYFQNFSIISLPANLLVLPTIPLAMILGFMSGLAGLAMPFLGQFIGYFAWFVTAVELGILKLLAKPDWATLSIKLEWYWIALAYTFIVISLMKLKKSKHDSEK